MSQRSVLSVRLLGLILGALLVSSLAALTQADIAAEADQPELPSTSPRFEEIYALLRTHCGTCHVHGGAEGPWSLDTPPSADRFPVCLERPDTEYLRCATYHQLTDSPGPEIPAWIRPEEAAASEPYVQACIPELSFHLGHSLPKGIPVADCASLLRWIEAGAKY